MKNHAHTSPCIIIGFLALVAVPAWADDRCKDLPDHATLTGALKKAVVVGDAKANGGFALNMWATVVARDGAVCAVAFTGSDWGDQWPGSRVISAQKANTANAFSLPGLAVSTANLFSAVQGGGSLFGLQFSNPVDPAVAYQGDAAHFGKPDDPLVGKRIGGVNVFGGGLALYNTQGKLVGALGVSGDTSCADHNIAWKTRHALNLDQVPAGVNKKGGSAEGDDNIIYDIADGKSTSGFGHPDCGLGEKAVAETLPSARPLNAKP
ncbi:MAG: heme-binding protein [Candidatus Competibacteraceae bacterium]